MRLTLITNPTKKMDTIQIRYGEDVTLQIDTGDTTDATADLFIGNVGEPYQFTTSTSIANGEGFFQLSATDTSIPVGTYHYQINTTDSQGRVTKYPEASCDDDLPLFIINDVLDVS